MIEGLYISQNGPASLLGAQESKVITREEHALRELRLKGAAFRAPRRAQSTHDYIYPKPLSQDAAARQVIIHQGAQPRLSVAPQPEDREVAPQEEAQAASPIPRQRSHAPPVVEEAGPRRRPHLGPPRRSYSVMDYEPVPPTQQPSTTLTLQDLPPELHYAVFDFLDPIDSTCLGLTSRHFYDIHRHMHGTVPLSARREGPNDMEWVWHLAGRVTARVAARGSAAGTANGTTTTNTLGDSDKNKNAALAVLRVRGRGLCRKCGISRCELHRHIAEWMGEGYEYCSVRERFGPAAPEGAKEYCYLRNPKDPHQCGRHRVSKSRPVSPVN